jgi:hypothetical protein
MALISESAEPRSLPKEAILQGYNGNTYPWPAMAGDIIRPAKASTPRKGESHQRLDFALKKVIKING